MHSDIRQWWMTWAAKYILIGSVVLLASVSSGQEIPGSFPMPDSAADNAPLVTAVSADISSEIAEDATPETAVALPDQASEINPAPALADVSSAIAPVPPAGDVVPVAVAAAAVATNASSVLMSPMPVANVTTSVLFMKQKAEKSWWITEEVGRASKIVPSFFGVRFVNSPRAVLAETESKWYQAGDVIAIRLWGFNDLPHEFQGQVRTSFKQNNEPLREWGGKVYMAPSAADCIAKYNFDTSTLEPGFYELDTSLMDESGKTMQQQVIPIIVETNQELEAKRAAQAQAETNKKAVAELKARQAAEKRTAAAAKAKLQVEAKVRRDAQTRARKEVERVAAVKAQARKEAELQSKAAQAAAEQKAAEDLKATRAAEAQAKQAAEQQAKAEADKAKQELKAQRAAEETARIAAQEAEKKAAAEVKAAQAAAEQKAAEDLKATRAAEAQAKQAAELQAKAEAEKAKQELKAQRAAELKAKAEARQQAEAEAKLKKDLEQKRYENVRAKHLAQEKAAIAGKILDLRKTDSAQQAQCIQAEADQKTAESKALALGVEALAAQADADAKAAAERQAKESAKQDAPPDVKTSRETALNEAKNIRQKAAAIAQEKAQEAQIAKKVAKDKAALVYDAKSKLVKQQKYIIEQQAELEIQAVRNAERKAKAEINPK